MRIPVQSRRRSRRLSSGQSLVEFALVLPVFLLLVLMAVDLGRLFYSYVTIHNSARVAANYAGLNPNASFIAGSAYDSTTKQEGLAGLSSVCPLPAGTSTPVPVFTDSALDTNSTTRDLGDDATVSVSCRFKVLTPIVGAIVGNNVTLSASARFPIRVGAITP